MNEYILWAILFVMPLLLWRPYRITKILILSFFAWMSWPPPRDDSDPDVGPRSGLAIQVDHRSGCQYLRSGFFFSTLTPRLNADGRPQCGHGSS